MKKEVRKKSVVPVYALAVLWLLYALFFPLYKILHFIILIVLAIVVYIVFSKKRILYDMKKCCASVDNMPKVLGGLGIAIISTNKGILTDKQARRENVGGEVLAFVW